jgi:20S proteasome subunit beta 2
MNTIRSMQLFLVFDAQDTIKDHIYTVTESSFHVTIMSTFTDAPSGFSFENVHRNAVIENLAKASNAKLPATKKTGTTIAGLVYDGGVVLGADTRATSGSEVAEKNCEKIHYIAPNIYCCGAGTAADTEKTTDMVRSNLELLRLETREQSRVVTACTLLKRHLHRYQGYVSAALVLGGCDLDGPHVYQIYPHGSTGKLPYTTMGSGSLAAMSVFESAWKSNLTETEAVSLVQRAIGAGIFNDLGSGSNCDICILRVDGTVSYLRNMVTPNQTEPLRSIIQRSARLTLQPGITPVIHSQFETHPVSFQEQFARLETESDVVEMEVEG